MITLLRGRGRLVLVFFPRLRWRLILGLSDRTRTRRGTRRREGRALVGSERDRGFIASTNECANSAYMASVANSGLVTGHLL